MGALLGSPREAGENLRPRSVPLAKQGRTCALARFPSRSGGNLKEGGRIISFNNYLREVRQREVEPIRARQ